jgi:2-polyprenyl-3-methyl-5-hydroxy-6-metoxy-1,4-benzoquinol methylase
MSQKEIYDKIYREIPGYNNSSSSGHYKKDDFISTYVSEVGGSLIDIGCGSGHNLKMALSMGIDAFGVDISEECCSKFLNGLPHECIDILAFCKSGKKFNNAICTDVLEHISKVEIDVVLESLSSISPQVLFGIANHSDNLLGIELHLIQENKDWWMKKLGGYYDSVCFLGELFMGSFFFIECEKLDDVA